VTTRTVKMHIEGEGCEDEFDNRSRTALRKNGHYNSRLTPYNHRTWESTENDVLQVVINSSEDRYRCVAPCWIAAKHRRSIKSANPMRAGLQLSCIQGFNTLRLVGNVTRKTNSTAVKSIMRTAE
jgi:hypothetical protein